MNADQVINKILSEAQQQADEISRQASDKCALQKQQTEEELANYRAETERLSGRAAEERFQRLLAGARMSNGQKVLSAKVAILNDVFAKAKEAVNKLPDEQYLSLMAAMMKQAVETGDEEVVVGINENRIDEAFVKKVSSDLGAGFKGNLRLSDKRAEIAGGFILSRGKVRINASTDVLIDRLRESMEIELSRELLEAE